MIIKVKGKKLICTGKPLIMRIQFCFSAENLGNRNFGYCLCKVDRGEFVSDKEGHLKEDMVTMHFHEVVPLEEELSAILYDCVSRSVNLEDKYSFVTLLWVLVELPTN